MPDETLPESITREIKRCTKLMNEYRTIPTGWFGAGMIEQHIEAAEKALAEQDTVEMVRTYVALKGMK
jgi:hypothetical protein